MAKIAAEGLSRRKIMAAGPGAIYFREMNCSVKPMSDIKIARIINALKLSIDIKIGWFSFEIDEINPHMIIPMVI